MLLSIFIEKNEKNKNHCEKLVQSPIDRRCVNGKLPSMFSMARPVFLSDISPTFGEQASGRGPWVPNFVEWWQLASYDEVPCWSLLSATETTIWMIFLTCHCWLWLPTLKKHDQNMKTYIVENTDSVKILCNSNFSRKFSFILWNTGEKHKMLGIIMKILCSSALQCDGNGSMGSRY